MKLMKAPKGFDTSHFFCSIERVKVK